MARGNNQEKEQENLPATTGGQLPAAQQKQMSDEEYARFLADHEGEGVSTAQEDNIVPLVYLLQGGSPQVKRGDPQYIAGAAAGDIWLRNEMGEGVISGAVGLMFQPCFFTKEWVEWGPERGSGIIEKHVEKPADAVQTVERNDDGREKQVWKRPNSGNMLVETRYMFGFALPGDGRVLPYVMPFSSTGHTVCRSWMTAINNLQVGGRKVPIYGGIWHLKSVLKTKGEFSWFTYQIALGTLVRDPAALQRGLAFFNSLRAGDKRADTDEVREAAAVSDGEVEGNGDGKDVPF